MRNSARLSHDSPRGARISTLEANFNVTASHGPLSAPERLLAVTRAQILPALSELLDKPPYSELSLALPHLEIDLGLWPDDPNWSDVRHVFMQKLRAILDPHLKNAPLLTVQTQEPSRSNQTAMMREKLAGIMALDPAHRIGELNAALRDDPTLLSYLVSDPNLGALLYQYNAVGFLERIEPRAPDQQLAALLAHVAANPAALPQLIVAMANFPLQRARLIAVAEKEIGLTAQFGTLEQLLNAVASSPDILDTIIARSRASHRQTDFHSETLSTALTTADAPNFLKSKYLLEVVLRSSLSNSAIMPAALQVVSNALRDDISLKITFATHLGAQATFASLPSQPQPQQFARLLRLISTDPETLSLLGQGGSEVDKLQLAVPVKLAFEMAEQHYLTVHSLAQLSMIAASQISSNAPSSHMNAPDVNAKQNNELANQIADEKAAIPSQLGHSDLGFIVPDLQYLATDSNVLTSMEQEAGDPLIARLADLGRHAIKSTKDTNGQQNSQHAMSDRNETSDAKRDLASTQDQIQNILKQIAKLDPPDQSAAFIALVAVRPETLSILEQPETLADLSNLSPDLQAAIAQRGATASSDFPISNPVAQILKSVAIAQTKSADPTTPTAQQGSTEAVNSILALIAGEFANRSRSAPDIIGPIDAQNSHSTMQSAPSQLQDPIRDILKQIAKLDPPDQSAAFIALVAVRPETLSILEQPEALADISNLSHDLQAAIARLDKTQQHDPPLLILQRMMRAHSRHDMRTTSDWLKKAAQNWPDLLAQIAPRQPAWLSGLLSDDTRAPALPAQIITAQHTLVAFLTNHGSDPDAANETAAMISSLWALMTTAHARQASIGKQDFSLATLWESTPTAFVSRLVALKSSPERRQLLEAAGLDWVSILRLDTLTKTDITTFLQTDFDAMVSAIRWLTLAEQWTLLTRLIPENAALLRDTLAAHLAVAAAPEVIMRRAITALLDGRSIDLESLSQPPTPAASPQATLMEALGIEASAIADPDQAATEDSSALLSLVPQLIDLIIPQRVQQILMTFHRAWPRSKSHTEIGKKLAQSIRIPETSASVWDALLKELMFSDSDVPDVHNQISRLLSSLEPDKARREADLRVVVARLTIATPSNDPNTRALRHAALTVAENVLKPSASATQLVEPAQDASPMLWGTAAAGLVIFHPYIGLLFSRLGIEPVEKRLQPHLIPRALAVLDALCGTLHPADPLYNYLLGLLPDTPAPSETPILKANDISTIASLIRSVIERWGKLGATSPEGLQATFINRTGMLESREDTVVLNVAKGPYDMLLDGLPWALSPIALSWMPRPLHVNWRNNDV